MNWNSPHEIYRDYHLPSRSAVYRHAHACGLFPLRKRNLRFVLERVLDQVNTVDITAMSIVHAAKLYARITDEGTLLDPPKVSLSAARTNSAKPSRKRTTLQHLKRKSGRVSRPRKKSGSNRNTLTNRNSPKPPAVNEISNV